jgi:hypothetical protein
MGWVTCRESHGAPIEDLRSETEQLEFFVSIDFEASSARMALTADILIPSPGSDNHAPTEFREVEPNPSINRTLFRCA